MRSEAENRIPYSYEDEKTEKLLGLIEIKGSNRFINRANLDGLLFAGKFLLFSGVGLAIGSSIGILASGVPIDSLFSGFQIKDQNTLVTNVNLGAVIGMGLGAYLSIATTWGWKLDKIK